MKNENVDVPSIVRIEEIQKEIERVKAKDDALADSFRDTSDMQMKWWDIYWNSGGHDNHRKLKALEYELKRERNRNLDVGDGCTLHLWTDSYACTVIKKTKKSITIQRDKAILSPVFKPEWEVGGFSAHCTNSEDQSYAYERDKNGETFICHWSEKEGRYRHGSDGSMKVSVGRHEYYDYNF